MVGGGCALIGAKLLGPRAGKFTPKGRPLPIPGHNMVMVVTGTFILAFGWFGFNPGSTLSGNDTRIAVIAVNTMLASASGALAAFVYMKAVFGRPDLSMLCNGMLAGLVAITAPCAFVGALAAVFIGAVAGVLVIVSALFIETRLRIDDPVGASSVHGTCGAWGAIALGLFANGDYGDGWNGVPGTVRGLVFGDASQLIAQGVGVVANLVWVFATTALAMKMIDVWVGNRSSVEAEFDGLDISELGAPGYFGETNTPSGAGPPAAT
jgi:Amt family ammonium transporter